MHTLKLHSPRSPTSATPTMLERTVSSRRYAPHPPDDSPSGPNDHASASSSFLTDYSGDESKTKRPSLSLLTSNYISRISHSCLCPIPCLVLCLVLVSVSVLSLVYRLRSLVCISPFEPKSRVAFYGLDGLESDFGSLGVPWCRSKHGKTVEWTSEDLLKGLEEFIPIYETRPIKNNLYGMGFDHSFGLWFIARRIKPDLMIESGAFKGHSTWVLRQAMPDTRIISLSPRHPEKYLKKGPAYVDGNCTYFSGKDFMDFGNVVWKTVMKKHGITDLSRVLIFFDDHQNELKRVKQALRAGFQHLVFEDNYDTGTGDHYSLRHICDQFYIRGVEVGYGTIKESVYFSDRSRVVSCFESLSDFLSHPGGGHSCFRDSDEARIRSKGRKFWEKAVDTDELCGPHEEWWGVRGWARDNFNHSNEKISYEQHFQNSQFIESILDVYWELPPVAGPSLTHQTRYDPARVTPPIVEDGNYSLFKRLGLTRLDKSVFNGYTQMVYIRISEQ